MGYDFYIGNAVPEFSKDYGKLNARWVVERVSLPNAPSFPNDEMTGQGNNRHPSYSVWAEFCRDTGIYPVFFDDGRIRAGHPGCQLISMDDYNTIKSALDKWQAKATLPPGFEGFNWNEGEPVNYDPYLARLIWLEFWMKWALDNCETPAIQNT